MLWIPGAIKKTKKLRFKPWWWLFLLAWGVMVAYVVMVSSMLKQNDEREDVMSQLGSGMTVLAKAYDVRQEMEVLPERLAEARRELWVAQAAFPSELNSNDIMHTILELAGESGVAVRSVETSPPVAEPDGAELPAADASEGTGGTRTLTYDVEATGDLSQLITYLETLEEGETSTTRFSAFTLQKADGLYLLGFELIAHARSTVSAASSPEEESTSDEEQEAISDSQETPRE